jgi:AcrR family transcriptional regulator
VSVHLPIPADMTPSRKRLPAQERKLEILRSAVTVFARSNYRAATVADIAAEARISEAAIYKHFPSKKSLFLQVLRHMSDRVIILWQREVDKEKDALKAVENMAITYYRRMMKHPEELKVQFQAISEVDDRDIARQLRQDHRNYRRFIEEVVQKGLRQRTIRKGVDVPTMGFLLDGVGILVNMMKLLSLHKELDEKGLRKIMDILIHSIRA